MGLGVESLSAMSDSEFSKFGFTIKEEQWIMAMRMFQLRKVKEFIVCPTCECSFNAQVTKVVKCLSVGLPESVDLPFFRLSSDWECCPPNYSTRFSQPSYLRIFNWRCQKLNLEL